MLFKCAPGEDTVRNLFQNLLDICPVCGILRREGRLLICRRYAPPQAREGLVIQNGGGAGNRTQVQLDKARLLLWAFRAVEFHHNSSCRSRSPPYISLVSFRHYGRPGEIEDRVACTQPIFVDEPPRFWLGGVPLPGMFASLSEGIIP